MREQGLPDWSQANGLVVYASSGFFRVVTAEGPVLLCRPRGRLRGRSGAWRDNRDAERTDAVSDLEEDLDADPETGEGGGLPADQPDPGGRDRGGGPAERRMGAEPPRARPATAPAASARDRGTATAVRDLRPRPGQPPADEPLEVPAVMAGDRVRCTDLGGGEGVIDEVLPRRAHLIRPPVANPDRVVLVLAWSAPPLSLAFVDRLVLEAALHGCSAAICLNKCDLLDDAETAAARAALAPMEAAGYPVLFTSALRGDGIAPLRALLKGELAVLAGPSGSGKSRLLSALVPDREVRSGEISERIGRGRHTTRAVELLPLPGGAAAEGPLALAPADARGWVADTPGFSRLDLREAEVQDLPTLYPEFRPHVDACRFRGCLHDSEPECAVRAAAEAGQIDPGRYERYLTLLNELRARPPKW